MKHLLAKTKKIYINKIDTKKQSSTIGTTLFVTKFRLRFDDIFGEFDDTNAKYL